MKTAHPFRIALAAFAVGACSTLFGGQEALAGSIKQSRDDTILTHNELVANLRALDALVGQKEGDLRPAYAAFTASLPGTRAAADRTTRQVATFHAEGDKHFATWQAEVETITDEGIRSRALKRLGAARQNWSTAAGALQEATVQFPALLGYLADIEKALNYDLTAEGVKSVRSASRSANESFSRIQGLVQKAVSALDELTASMSSAAKS